MKRKTIKKDERGETQIMQEKSTARREKMRRGDSDSKEDDAKMRGEGGLPLIQESLQIESTGVPPRAFAVPEIESDTSRASSNTNALTSASCFLLFI